MKIDKSISSRLKKHNVYQSYSDMMCGLLMLFILVMVVCLFQAEFNYRTALEEQEAREVEQREYTDAIVAQRDELLAQQEAIASQQAELAAQSAELEAQRETLESQKAELDSSQSTIDSQNAFITELQQQLESQNISIAELDSALELVSTQGQETIEQILGVKADLISALSQELANNGANVVIDAETGAMELSSDVTFGYDDTTLTEEGKAMLSEVLPLYCNVLLSDTYVDNIAEIVIDGYTDDQGSYEYNLALSQGRSLAVANYLLEIADTFLSAENVSVLRSKLTVNGHSMNNLILDENGDVDQSASRRVEVKFRLKDEEMIQEISDIVSGVVAE